MITRDPVSPALPANVARSKDVSPDQDAPPRDLETRMVHLRSSLDARVDEFNRRTDKLRHAIDLPERIKERPLQAVAVGLAAGAAVGLLLPKPESSGSISGMIGGLISALMLRAGRQLATDLAGHAYRTYLDAGARADEDGAPIPPRGAAASARAEA